MTLILNSKKAFHKLIFLYVRNTSYFNIILPSQCKMWFKSWHRFLTCTGIRLNIPSLVCLCCRLTLPFMRFFNILAVNFEWAIPFNIRTPPPLLRVFGLYPLGNNSWRPLRILKIKVPTHIPFRKIKRSKVPTWLPLQKLLLKTLSLPLGFPWPSVARGGGGCRY